MVKSISFFINIFLKMLFLALQAPIYVSREIVLTDAIRIGYGMGRMRDAKPTYDVSLDRYSVDIGGLVFAILCCSLSLSIGYILSSAADGPDVLSEELDLVKNMDLAVKEERYKDAGMNELADLFSDKIFLCNWSVTISIYV